MRIEEVIKEAMPLTQELIDHRRWLHRHAETGFDLMSTNTYVAGALRDMGIEPKRKGKMGICADITGREGSKTFLLRADMDALPIREESGESFACASGCMHACGHDMHTAMLLGASKLLLHHRESFSGTVRLMFQPAEETLEGAKDMIDSGILDGVDGAMMLHVIPGVPFPPGTPLPPKGGVGAPSADYFTITVRGKGCHGATPHKGIDPILPTANIILGLQEILTREIDSSENTTVTIGSVHAGDVGNVIPDASVISGTARTYRQPVQEEIKSRIVQISQSIAQAYRAAAKVDFHGSCPPLYNDPALCELLSRYLSPLLDAQKSPSGCSGASEDFSYVSCQVPAVVIALAAGEPEKGFTFPLHHPKVRFDEAALPYGSAILAGSAMYWLNQAQEEL